mgnify:CR=1 FL=1|nr:MAG TPA: hypothetical protein [Caudoviricetes sp.]
MTIKNLFDASENVTNWTIGYDGGKYPTDLFNPLILDAIGNYRVRAFSVKSRENGVEMELELTTTIAVAS